MKIAILYMCTGRYSLFWNDFYHSAEKYFLYPLEKHYFVFTDTQIGHLENCRVHRIQQDPLSWPDITLKRYHSFLNIENLLKDFDYIFFFNSNACFCAPVDEHFLPQDNTMLFVQHPGFFNTPREQFTYERNPLSQAYIAPYKGKVYVCGGVNGGRASTYISFMHSIKKATDIDTENNITAVWHDESHSNRYALDHPHTLRDPSYCYPEGWALPFTPRIRIRDKSKLGGHAYLRGQCNTPTYSRPQQITTQIMGGLGNQMFQYAMGRSLAFRLDATLILDTSWFSSDQLAGSTFRKYQLHIFPKIQGCIDATHKNKTHSYLPTCQNLLHNFYNRVVRKFYQLCNKNTRFICESQVPDKASFYTIKEKCTLSGYWQNEYFFEDIDFLLQKEFSFPPLPESALEIAQKIRESIHSVSVHVRRGDYASDTITNAFHGVCSPVYYAKSLEYIRAHYGLVPLFIFSDEPEWVKGNFETYGHPSTIIDLHTEENAHYDMHLMTLCTHHIIANSSFSWWGAWLGEQKGMSITCAPISWFASQDYSHKNPCPERWICF